MAIADVYDALITDRPYRKGLSHEKAVEIILGGRGSQFDPQLIDAFGEVHGKFHAIAEQFADTSVNEPLHSSTQKTVHL
jgi:putative two-component system response regulator